MTDVSIPKEAIAALPGLSGMAVKVLVALCSFMEEDGSCGPSREEIGRRAGINRLGTISKAVGELKRAQIITVERPRPIVGYRLAEQWRA